MEFLLDVPGLPAATRYAYAVTATGRIAFLAGQVPTDAHGELVGPGDMGAQAERALRNLGAVIAALGADWSRVVKLTWYLTDVSRVAEIREARVRVMGDGVPPAATLVQVAALVSPDYLVEVDAVVELDVER
jgi:enamine deaminase RidA (YjgF/YER057c/UK114 family)